MNGPIGETYRVWGSISPGPVCLRNTIPGISDPIRHESYYTPALRRDCNLQVCSIFLLQIGSEIPEIVFHRNARRDFISHTVFLKSVCKSQFPHKSVNLFFISVIEQDKLTDLWGS